MPTKTDQKTRPTKSAAAKQRRIQKGVDAKDKASREEQPKPAQLGARRYPQPPFPKQHHPKPGHEYKIQPAPLYDAPFYIGSKKLDGKVALITGGDSGIGRAVAVLFAREGADVAISYLTEKTDAEATKKDTGDYYNGNPAHLQRTPRPGLGIAPLDLDASLDKEALSLAERSDLSPNQAKELIREYGRDSHQVRDAAQNLKAES